MAIGPFEGFLGLAVLAIAVLVIYKVIKVVIPLVVAVGIVAVLYYTGTFDSLFDRVGARLALGA